MDKSTIVDVIGFDLGDAETALSKVNARQATTNPAEIFSTLAKNSSGIIKTVVGYTTEGEVLVGLAAANAKQLRHNGLKVGFKTVPTAGDNDYATIVSDFVNALVGQFEVERLFDVGTSKFVIGYPSKWKNLNEGRPVAVLESILRQTLLAGSADLALVPESRGAMVEAMYAGIFNRDNGGNNALTRSMLAGWALVIDVGSSTTDFTAVNLGARKAEPVDIGEELGARLIDRAIVDQAIAAGDGQYLEAYFRDHPEQRAKFELACRDYKEEYFSGQEIERDFAFTDNGKRVYISVSLDHVTMQRLTSEVPIATVLGKQMSWRGGFRHLLEQVKVDLAKRNVEPITAILLTGGASKMSFVREECRSVFPDIDRAIVQAERPQFTVANGLARWGRIQIQTHMFSEAVKGYCDSEIPQRADHMVDGLFVQLSELIANRVVSIIKNEFTAWKNSDYNTIDSMKIGIEKEIRVWLKDGLPSEIAGTSGPALEVLANELAMDIKSLENEFAVPVGTLGGKLSASSVKDHNIKSDINLGAMDMTGGASDVFGAVIGIIAGLVTGLVMLYVVPIVLGIVVNIIAIISTTLASMVFAILVSNPIGWAILAALGVAAFRMGAKARELALEKIPTFDLPGWVRGLVNESSVHQKIEAKRSEIVGQIGQQLRSDNDLRAKIVDESTKFFRDRLLAAADDARMLIN